MKYRSESDSFSTFKKSTILSSSEKLSKIMKTLPISFAFLGLVLPVMGQDEAQVSKWDVKIPEFESIADGTPSKPAPKPEPIDFKVISSRTKQVDVIKAPEMHDLPPITGRINVTMRMVEDPGLPEPPKPLPAIDPEDPKVIVRMEELREHYQGTSLLFLSASVYDHKRTLMRIHPNGDVGNEVTAWSNLDLNHLTGFSTYQVNDGMDGTPHYYSFIMGIGNENPEMLARLSSTKGWEYKPPEIPELPDVEEGGPAFVVMEGDSDSTAMATLEQIHDLYRKEGKRMEAAFHAREKARAERKAYLLANPPIPEDVTISFWKRDKPSAAGLKNLGTEGKR